MRVIPLVRSLVSYLPSRTLIGLRRLADVPNWVMRLPHEADYLAFRHFRTAHPKVVDVGANRGQAVVSLNRVLRQPRIWSFEPNPDLAAYLSRRFRSKNLVAYSHGLGASSETLTLYMPRYGNTIWDTRASVVEDEARQHLNSDQFYFYSEQRAGIETIEVEIRTLDELDLAPDILKIDVEGAEAAVVEGGMATIKAFRPVIVLEGDAGQSEQILSSLGYRRHRYEPDRNRFVAGDSGDLNTFLLHPDHYPLFDGIQIAERHCNDSGDTRN